MMGRLRELFHNRTGGFSMALDGIVISNIVSELSEQLKGSRISKIAQPEPDELLLTFKGPAGQRRLLLSASASLQLIYLFLGDR